MDTRIIVPSAGPYAGQRMTVDAGEADRAISEGWAADPFAEKGPDDQRKEHTAEEAAEMANKAEAAAKRWRGEDDKAKDKPKASAKPEAPVARDMAAGPGHSYETREEPKAAAHKNETHRRR